jgi:hypothetical protein
MEDKKKIPVSLESNKNDYVASAAKSVLGVVPFAGSLLTELAGTIIPNQRMDRIVNFAVLLEERLTRLEEESIRNELKNEHFSDLLEEALVQAARTTSEERRIHIANLISNSLSIDAIAFQESKHLLRILGNLNDIEIIWLRYYLDSTMGGDEEFRNKHKDILSPISREMGSPQPQRDKAALQDSYKDHLSQLGLLKLEDDRNGRRSYKLAPFGRLLLREISLAKPA